MPTTRAEIAAAEAAKALKWPAIFGPEFDLYGDASSIISFFQTVAELSKRNSSINCNFEACSQILIPVWVSWFEDSFHLV